MALINPYHVDRKNDSSLGRRGGPRAARGDGTKEANVLIKSRGNVETSPSLDVFAIFRKFRFSRVRGAGRETAFKVAMEEKEGRTRWNTAERRVPEQPPLAPHHLFPPLLLPFLPSLRPPPLSPLK